VAAASSACASGALTAVSGGGGRVRDSEAVS